MVGCLEFGRQLGQLLTEPARARCSRASIGRYGDAQPVGQLARGEALGVLEDQQLGVAGRQPSQRVLHQLLPLVPDQPGERRGGRSISALSCRAA